MIFIKFEARAAFPSGWLAGARDPFIGQALALMHKKPADPWTVEELARRVGLSRTRFAERFNHFLGEPPMAYLARWRVKLGAELLQSTEESVGRSCRHRRIWFRSGVQSGVQAGVGLSSGPVSA